MSIISTVVREGEKKKLDDRLNKCRYALAKAQGKEYTPWYPTFFWWGSPAADPLIDDLPTPPSKGGARTRRSKRNYRRNKSRRASR